MRFELSVSLPRRPGVASCHGFPQPDLCFSACARVSSSSLSCKLCTPPLTRGCIALRVRVDAHSRANMTRALTNWCVFFAPCCSKTTPRGTDLHRSRARRLAHGRARGDETCAFRIWSRGRGRATESRDTSRLRAGGLASEGPRAPNVKPSVRSPSPTLATIDI